MNQQMPKLTDPDVQAILLEGKFTFLNCASAMIGPQLSMSAWNPETIGKAVAAKQIGHDIVLEISTTKSGAASVAMVAVAPDGKRHELGRVSEPEATEAN